ncbi:MAG: glycosyl hydrolase 53 family protein [bacterium]|nr:glycosyl hydrolase 53 family protein [bacterium]
MAENCNSSSRRRKRVRVPLVLQKSFIYEVDFDIIGLSYYPWWHGDPGELSDNVENLSGYGKEIQIVETAYPYMEGWCDNTNNIVGKKAIALGFYASEEGQSAFLNLLQNIVASYSK